MYIFKCIAIKCGLISLKYIINLYVIKCVFMCVYRYVIIILFCARIERSIYRSYRICVKKLNIPRKR